MWRWLSTTVTGFTGLAPFCSVSFIFWNLGKRSWSECHSSLENSEMCCRGKTHMPQEEPLKPDLACVTAQWRPGSNSEGQKGANHPHMPLGSQTDAVTS